MRNPRRLNVILEQVPDVEDETLSMPCTACHDVARDFGRQGVMVKADPRFKLDSVFDAPEGVGSIGAVINRLGVVKPTVVMVIIGGANEMSSEVALKVRALFERSLAPTLDSEDVVVVTGGGAQTRA